MPLDEARHVGATGHRRHHPPAADPPVHTGDAARNVSSCMELDYCKGSVRRLAAVPKREWEDRMWILSDLNFCNMNVSGFFSIPRVLVPARQ
jgi:hypothetical protein